MAQTIGRIVTPDYPSKLSKKELMDKVYKKRGREYKIARMRASVLKSQITNAYTILENIRFDFLSDTMFRDYIVVAKRQLEGAMSDFLLSDAWWEKCITEHRDMTPQEYDKQQKHDSQPAQSKIN